MSQFESDPLILKRVLINTVKNALEASEEGAVIRMGTKIVNRHVIFWINNPGVIPEHAQSQIFQRSFSTKGTNRGIGTYSIKLLTTRYLKGSVSFKSESDEGTTFFINIPHSLRES
jgi:sensor histidine kinase regulating citrate/malate metabolism